MKFFSSMMLGMLVLLSSTTGFALGFERYVEGVHYTKVDQAEVAPGAVVEFFSYGCPHCAHLEPALEQWLKQKPASVKFARIPAGWNPRFGFLARVYYGLEAIGQAEKLSQPLFDHLHKEQKPLASVEDAVAFVRAHGGDAKAFEAAFNSDATNEAVEKGNVIYARYQVRGVPALLVNGQYMTSLTQAGSETELFEVVNFLLSKP